MAIRPLNTLKEWFRTAMKPTQEQFSDVWDSFWHKDEKIPVNQVSNLQEILNNKAEYEHSHQISEIDGLNQELAGKADIGHTHDLLQPSEAA